LGDFTVAELEQKLVNVLEQNMQLDHANKILREQIAELKASVAPQENGVFVCPIRDIDCGDRPANWCDTCPKRATHASAAPVVPWVSVENRMPPPETDVLVRCIRGISESFDVAGVFHGEWMSCATERETKGDVTHWMPLPPLPTN
jgi:hypothetical protein